MYKSNMSNQELELPNEAQDKLMQGGNTDEAVEQPMNGGKKSGRTRKTSKKTKTTKKGKLSKKKGQSMKKKGGALKKSLNGLAAVGALFGAQQLYARRNKKAVKKTMKRKSSKKLRK